MSRILSRTPSLASVAAAAVTLGLALGAAAPARAATFERQAVVLTLGAIVPSGSLAYELQPATFIALRLGWSAGPALRAESSADDMLWRWAHGPMFEASFMTTAEHRFEVAFGATVVLDDATGVTPVSPSIFVGYRYQPADDWLLVRVGAGWTHWFSTPITASFGATF